MSIGGVPPGDGGWVPPHKVVQLDPVQRWLGRTTKIELTVTLAAAGAVAAVFGLMRALQGAGWTERDVLLLLGGASMAGMVTAIASVHLWKNRPLNAEELAQMTLEEVQRLTPGRLATLDEAGLRALFIMRQWGPSIAAELRSEQMSAFPPAVAAYWQEPSWGQRSLSEGVGLYEKKVDSLFRDLQSLTPDRKSFYNPRSARASHTPREEIEELRHSIVKIRNSIKNEVVRIGQYQLAEAEQDQLPYCAAMKDAQKRFAALEAQLTPPTAEEIQGRQQGPFPPFTIAQLYLMDENSWKALLEHPGSNQMIPADSFRPKLDKSFLTERCESIMGEKSFPHTLEGARDLLNEFERVQTALLDLPEIKMIDPHGRSFSIARRHVEPLVRAFMEEASGLYKPPSAQQVPHLDLGCLNVQQIFLMSPEAIAALSDDQIKRMSWEQYEALPRDRQERVPRQPLTADEVRMLLPEGWQALSAEQIRRMERQALIVLVTEMPWLLRAEQRSGLPPWALLAECDKAIKLGAAHLKNSEPTPEMYAEYAQELGERLNTLIALEGQGLSDAEQAEIKRLKAGVGLALKWVNHKRFESNPPAKQPDWEWADFPIDAPTFILGALQWGKTDKMPAVDQGPYMRHKLLMLNQQETSPEDVLAQGIYTPADFIAWVADPQNNQVISDPVLNHPRPGYSP